jgi:hypothetical protein
MRRTPHAGSTVHPRPPPTAPSSKPPVTNARCAQRPGITKPLLGTELHYLLRRHVATHSRNDSVRKVEELKAASIINGTDPSARSHSDQTDAPSGTSGASVESRFRLGQISIRHDNSGLDLIDTYGC